jgi:hypothetical protein
VMLLGCCCQAVQGVEQLLRSWVLLAGSQATPGAVLTQALVWPVCMVNTHAAADSIQYIPWKCMVGSQLLLVAWQMSVHTGGPRGGMCGCPPATHSSGSASRVILGWSVAAGCMAGSVAAAGGARCWVAVSGCCLLPACGSPLPLCVCARTSCCSPRPEPPFTRLVGAARQGSSTRVAEQRAVVPPVKARCCIMVVEAILLERFVPR